MVVRLISRKLGDCRLYSVSFRVSFESNPVDLNFLIKVQSLVFNVRTSWTVLGKKLRDGFGRIGDDFTLFQTPSPRRLHEARKQVETTDYLEA